MLWVASRDVQKYKTSNLAIAVLKFNVEISVLTAFCWISCSLTEPEVAGGCADGCVRMYDLYSGRCSRIFRFYSSPSLNE